MFLDKKVQNLKMFWNKKGTKPQNSMYYNSCPQLCGPQICVLWFFAYICRQKRYLWKKHSFFKYQ